ncbi:MAG: 3-phosphoshikimate 1-carboxyvinyltransferase [Oscillospiraceae bacterium]|jgi:3-phosphoshikimate 1-carboxyvinyltransferase|nr:3-phosphoshikimate 1-carboxyvinyltransferase [Oscillospiraceae bacterium]
MTVTIRPGALAGVIAAMPSKYDLHRLMIASHLAGMGLEGLPVISDDIAVTKECLSALNNAQCSMLNCRESGSTLRFLLPVAAALGKEVTFTGGGRLPERPMQPLIDQLRAHGCHVDRDRLPIAVSGQLRPGTFTLPGDVSSQYVTGLLFALPLLAGGSEIALASPLQSRGYVDMTLRALRKFGVSIHETAQGFGIPAPQRYLSIVNCQLSIDMDWSSAAFWLAAGALGSGVRVTGLDETSAQPDRAIAGLLRDLPGEIDVSQCPDLAPILAVVMALTPGERRIVNAARLRLKESDRLRAMALNLTALGADAAELPDGLAIRGQSSLRGGEADSFGDHRIAMAMAIAALRCEGAVTLRGAEAVRKSYPAFWEDYRRLGGQI